MTRLATCLLAFSLSGFASGCCNTGGCSSTVAVELNWDDVVAPAVAHRYDLYIRYRDDGQNRERHCWTWATPGDIPDGTDSIFGCDNGMTVSLEHVYTEDGREHVVVRDFTLVDAGEPSRADVEIFADGEVFALGEDIQLGWAGGTEGTRPDYPDCAVTCARGRLYVVVADYVVD